MCSSDLSDPGVPLGERVSSQQDQGTSFKKRKRLADTYGVRAQQIDLEFANLRPGNANITELAYAGCDGVGDLVPGDQRVDDRARPYHRFASVRGEKNRAAFGSNFAHRAQSEIVTVKVKSVQNNVQLTRLLVLIVSF